MTASNQGSLKDYIVKHEFGIDIDANVFIDESTFQMYVIEVQLPPENKHKFDQRELAYRLAKITNNYFQTLQTQLFDEN